jgi:magnesium transporter
VPGTHISRPTAASRRPGAGRRPGAKRAPEGPDGSQFEARLFDADRTDRKVTFDAKSVESLTDRQLLWIDLPREADAGAAADGLDWLPFERANVERMWAAPLAPKLSLHGEYFLAHLLIVQADGHGDKTTALDLAVARNVVLTAHDGPIAFLAEINERVTVDTSLGEIDSIDFASVVVDGLLTSYLELTDQILARVDELDAEALKSTGRRDLLAEMVQLRHRIAAIRRTLAAHRSVIVGMSGADFGLVTGAADAHGFGATSERFESAIGAIDAAREALLGTFDIHMSRTAQRTNDVMKTLTVVTVLLLPTGAIAGFMGMNEKPPFSNDDPLVFWAVVGLIVVVAIGTLLIFRARRWI